MTISDTCLANRIISQDVLERFIELHSDKIKNPNVEELKVLRSPGFEQSDGLLFLSCQSELKLQPGEIFCTFNFSDLTEFGLSLLMRPAFQALEKQKGTVFRNVYEAIDAYIFACIEANRVSHENTQICLVLYSDDFWADVAKMNDASIAYTDDGLPDNYEYQDDSPYRCQVAKYFDSRCQDTLSGWTYTVHPNSICLTPPDSWKEVPKVLNVNWYKRPLYWSMLHEGYFLSCSPDTVDKVIDLGPFYDPNN